MVCSEFIIIIFFFLCQLDQTHLKFGCVNMDNTMGIISTKKNSDSPVNKKYFLWSCSCHLQINSIISFNLICKMFKLKVSIYFLK